jgi:hypothetical protein
MYHRMHTPYSLLIERLRLCLARARPWSISVHLGVSDQLLKAHLARLDAAYMHMHMYIRI